MESTYETVEMKISEIKRADYNPRKITKVQRRELRKSIEKFGVLQPFIVNDHEDRKNVLVGGHQRLGILIEEEVETVQVVKVNLNLEDEKELNIRLNKNTGEFDQGLLEDFFNKGDLKSFGFLDSELKFLDEEANKAAESEEPKYPIVPHPDEKYSTVTIFCKSGMDFNWLVELLGLGTQLSYKCTLLGMGKVIDFEDLKAKLEEAGCRW